MYFELHYTMLFIINILVIFGGFISFSNSFFSSEFSYTLDTILSLKHTYNLLMSQKKLQKKVIFAVLNFFSILSYVCMLNIVLALIVSVHVSFELYYMTLFIINIDMISVMIDTFILLLKQFFRT